MNSESTPKQVFRVTIFNQNLSMTSSTSAAEFHHIANQVDALMGMIASKSGTSDGARVGVLAAMHLADRLHMAERRLESALNDVKVIQAGAQEAVGQARASISELEELRADLEQTKGTVQSLTDRLSTAEHQRSLLEAELASARGSLSGAQAALSASEAALFATRAELEAERSRIGRDADRLHSILEKALEPGLAGSTPRSGAVTPPQKPGPTSSSASSSSPTPQTRDLFSYDDSDIARGATA